MLYARMQIHTVIDSRIHIFECKMKRIPLINDYHGAWCFTVEGPSFVSNPIF